MFRQLGFLMFTQFTNSNSNDAKTPSFAIVQTANFTNVQAPSFVNDQRACFADFHAAGFVNLQAAFGVGNV